MQYNRILLSVISRSHATDNLYAIPELRVRFEQKILLIIVMRQKAQDLGCA
jgi:hypothetical protein